MIWRGKWGQEEEMSMRMEKMRKGDMGREEHQGGHATLLIICIHL